jgi:hypothetical protein
MSQDDVKKPDAYYSKLTLIEDENKNTEKEDRSSIEMLCPSS